MYSVKEEKVIFDSNPEYEISSLSVMIELDDREESATVVKHGDFKDVENYFYAFSEAMGTCGMMYFIRLKDIIKQPEEQVGVLNYMIDHTLSSLTYDFVDSVFNGDEKKALLVAQRMLG